METRQEQRLGSVVVGRPHPHKLACVEFTLHQQAQYELFLSLHERCAVRYRPQRTFPGPAVVVRCVDAGAELVKPRDVLRAPMVTDLAERLRDEFAAVS